MSLFQIANPALPLWIVMPLGAIAAIAIVLHLASLPRAEMPPSRRRIRAASGVMLLALTALLTYAIGFVGMLPGGGGAIGHVRIFVLIWMAIIGLLPIILALAAMDMFNTWWLQREARRAFRQRLRADMLRKVEIHVNARLASRAGIASRNNEPTRGNGDDAQDR